jgi:hypothetical protein
MEEIAGPNPAEPIGFWILLVDQSIVWLLIFLTYAFHKFV